MHVPDAGGSGVEHAHLLVLAVPGLPSRRQLAGELMLIATGQRRGEVASMRLEQLDLDGGRLWTLGRDDTKAGRAHDVPLNDLAFEVLDEVPRVTPKAEDGTVQDPIYVFTTNGDTPVSGVSKAKRKFDAEVGKI